MNDLGKIVDAILDGDVEEAMERLERELTVRIDRNIDEVGKKLDKAADEMDRMVDDIDSSLSTKRRSSSKRYRTRSDYRGAKIHTEDQWGKENPGYYHNLGVYTNSLGRIPLQEAQNNIKIKGRSAFSRLFCSDLPEYVLWVGKHRIHMKRIETYLKQGEDSFRVFLSNLRYDELVRLDCIFDALVKCNISPTHVTGQQLIKVELNKRDTKQA